MAVYLYTAYDLFTQKKIKGEIQGESEESVRNNLMGKNLYPKSIKRKTIWNSDIPLFKWPIGLIDIHFFCQQLAALIKADIGIVKGLEICRQQITHKTLTKHIEQIYLEVSTGKVFSQAIEEEKIFPEFVVQLIKSGELSGRLDEVMERVVQYLSQQLTLRKKVKKALAYPMIVLIMIVVVVIILMTKVVPAYMKLLEDTGAPIPLPTQMIIKISNLIINHWILLGGGLLGLVGLILSINKIPYIKSVGDRIRLKLPLFGELYKKHLAGIFSSTMSMLIASGIPIIQAMEITKNVMGNTVAQEEMNHAIALIKQGKRLLEALGDSSIFSPLLLSMISVGEESGTLDEMLANMGNFFKEDVERTMEHLTLLIEPIMLIIVAVIIGGIMAAIMLPTFSAVTSVM